VAQFKDYERLAIVGSTDETTRFKINRGYRLIEMLKQREGEGYDTGVQILLLYACIRWLFDDLTLQYTRALKSFIVTV